MLAQLGKHLRGREAPSVLREFLLFRRARKKSRKPDANACVCVGGGAACYNYEAHGKLGG